MEASRPVGAVKRTLISRDWPGPKLNVAGVIATVAGALARGTGPGAMKGVPYKIPELGLGSRHMGVKSASTVLTGMKVSAVPAGT